MKSYGITIHSSESSQIWYDRYINFAQFTIDLKVNVYLSVHVHRDFADYVFVFYSFNSSGKFYHPVFIIQALETWYVAHFFFILSGYLSGDLDLENMP